MTIMSMPDMVSPRVTSPKDRLRPLDYLLIVILTFPVFGTFFPIGTYLAVSVSEVSGPSADVGRETTVVLAFILLTIFTLFAISPPQALLSIKRNWLVLAFVGWAFITSRWAEIPALSFNRSGRMLIFILYAIYIVEVLEPARMKRIVTFALLLSLCASLAIIAVYPPLSGTTDGRGLAGTWRGAMIHKNILGYTAGLGLIWGLVMWKTHSRQWKLYGALSIMGVLLLILSNSFTTILSLSVIIFALMYLQYVAPLMKDRVVALALGIVFVTLVVVLVNVAGSVLEIFGRDSTFTGRSSAWAFAYFMIDRNPFWGYGHGAWSMPNFSHLALSTLNYFSPHAHNMWIDFRLQLGIPGFILGVMMWGVASYNVAYLLMTRPLAEFALPMAIFGMISIRTYSETSLVEPALFDNFWFALAFASLAKAVANEKSRRGSAQVETVSQSQRAILNSRRFGAENLQPLDLAEGRPRPDSF